MELLGLSGMILKYIFNELIFKIDLVIILSCTLVEHFRWNTQSIMIISFEMHVILVCIYG